MNTITNSNPYIEPIKKFLMEHEKNPQVCTYCGLNFKFCSLSLEEEKSEDQKECEKDIDNLAVTRCFHIFHKNCLEICLKVIDECPTCLNDTINVTLRNSTLRGITAFNLLLVQPKNNQEVAVSSSGKTEEVIKTSENPNNDAIVDYTDTLAEFTPTEESSDAILKEYTSEEEEDEDEDVLSYSSQLPDMPNESSDLPKSESKKRKRPNIDSSIKSGEKQDPRSPKKLKTGEEFNLNAYEEEEFNPNAFASDNESDGSEKEVTKKPSNSPSQDRCLIS